MGDAKTLVVAGFEATGLDLATGKKLFAWEAPVRSEQQDMKRAAAGQNPAELPVWQAFAMSPDGSTAAYILSSDPSGPREPERIVVCEGRTGRLLHRLDDSGLRTADYEQMAFSPDGKRLATLDGKVVHLWDVARGAKLRTLTGHRGDIQALAFSRDGRRVATASADSTVLVWDVVDRHP